MSTSGRAFALGLISVVLPFVCYSQTLDFKGIVIGRNTTRQALTSLMVTTLGDPSVECTNYPGLTSDNYGCTAGTTIAGEVAVVLVAVYADFVHEIIVVFRPSGYAAVKSALVKKFGMPDGAHTTTLQNAMGARFHNEALRWEGEGGSVMDLLSLNDEWRSDNDPPGARDEYLDKYFDSTLTLHSGAMTKKLNKEREAAESDL